MFPPLGLTVKLAIDKESSPGLMALRKEVLSQEQEFRVVIPKEASGPSMEGGMEFATEIEGEKIEARIEITSEPVYSETETESIYTFRGRIRYDHR